MVLAVMVVFMFVLLVGCTSCGSIHSLSSQMNISQDINDLFFSLNKGNISVLALFNFSSA